MNSRTIRIVVAAVAAVGIGTLAGCSGTSTAGVAAAQAGMVVSGTQPAPMPPSSTLPQQTEPTEPETTPTSSTPTSTTAAESTASSPTPSQPRSTEPPTTPPVARSSSRTNRPPTAPSSDFPAAATTPRGTDSAEADPADYPGTVTPVGFSSPSGNIGCGFLDDGSVVCQIDKFTYTPPQHDCGASGWGFNFRITSAGRAEMFCAGDVESGGPVLAYDHSITVNGMQCTSQTDGVSCLDTRTGHGFSVSKAAYDFFGQPDSPSRTTTTGLTTSPGSPSSSIVGQWLGHGRQVVIGADGTGELTYRIYKFCGDDPTPPCDKVVGNEIHAGGDVRFTLTGGLSGTSARGKVTASTDPTHPVGAPVTANLQGHNLILNIMDAPFCKEDAPSSEWNCGA